MQYLVCYLPILFFSLKTYFVWAELKDWCILPLLTTLLLKLFICNKNCLTYLCGVLWLWHDTALTIFLPGKGLKHLKIKDLLKNVKSWTASSGFYHILTKKRPKKPKNKRSLEQALTWYGFEGILSRKLPKISKNKRPILKREAFPRALKMSTKTPNYVYFI